MSLHIEQSPEVTESPEAEQVEVAQTETTPEQPQEITTRPDNIPEKFWDTTSGTVNTKALLESYAHLEQKMSSKEPETPKEPETKPDNEAKPDAPSFDEAIQKATEEFQANGELSDEMKKSLGDIGISEALINGYIKGVEADSKAALGEVHTVAGSEESWTEIMEWAALNINADKTKELNEGLASNDNRINTAIELKSLFDNAVHNPQVAIQGTVGATSDTGPFKSQGELVTAMSDPRYKNDTDYQQKVHARLAKM